VKVNPGEEYRLVNLRDDWIQTDVRVGDIINIIGSFTPLPPYSRSRTFSAPSPISTITLTANANLLILHPDTLLTTTALSSATYCPRKAILSLLLRSTSCTLSSPTDITPSLVWGNILHEVMQACLRAGQWDDLWVEERISDEVRKEKCLGDLVKLGGVGVEEAIREVKTRARGLKVFGEKYMRNVPQVYILQILIHCLLLFLLSFLFDISGN
jgi:DNA replication ATP-dependent helicase Dna2